MSKAIYLIGAANGLTKIGKADSPRKRLSQLRSNSPVPLELLHMAAVDDAGEVEESLHRLHAAKRSHGEWFRLTDDDVAEVRARFPATEVPFASGKYLVNLGLTREEITVIRLAAKERGLPVTQFIILSALEAAKEILGNPV